MLEAAKRYHKVPFDQVISVAIYLVYARLLGVDRVRFG